MTHSLSSLFNIPPFLVVKMAKYFISSKLIAWKLPAFNMRAAVCQAAGRESPTRTEAPGHRGCLLPAWVFTVSAQLGWNRHFLLRSQDLVEADLWTASRQSGWNLGPPQAKPHCSCARQLSLCSLAPVILSKDCYECLLARGRDLMGLTDVLLSMSNGSSQLVSETVLVLPSGNQERKG